MLTCIWTFFWQISAVRSCTSGDILKAEVTERGATCCSYPSEAYVRSLKQPYKT
ncbi:hypothetical protein PR003_g8820 [Phytophthora rubi]|uniref:Uncharacterized protein n=1 Tax=Phytophthora rubi TaxID=129364 RepID=A0A6A4FW91_9STRA|nr:hypothetical protein PR002_g8463 [Phytophthora rubi]KAE9343736.1 hypothetical protein PR003_g8820 [Phytophthora rubi]